MVLDAIFYISLPRIHITLPRIHITLLQIQEIIILTLQLNDTGEGPLVLQGYAWQYPPCRGVLVQPFSSDFLN